MDIKKFSEIIKERLEERTGLEVRLVEVTKNNSVTYHGINIIVPGTNILPTIYLEPYLQAYEQNVSLEEITEKIINIWEREKAHPHFDMEWFSDFEQVKDRIAYKLVNYEANRELLEKVPHEKVLDLAKVYYVSVKTDERGEETILVQSSHLDLWGITADQLRLFAAENTSRLFPAEIRNLSEAIKDMLEDDIAKERFEDEKECVMYVATNRAKTFGAAVMCYTDTIREFAEQKRNDLIIIPCSIHEIIIIVPFEKGDIKQLKAMVHEVNRTQLSREEILSDSVYIYRRETDSISIA